MAELKINTETKPVTLEEAITKGKNALIPYEFKYPNTDMVVEVKLKPVTSQEFNNVAQIAKVNPETTIDVELLKIAVFNIDDTLFDEEIISNLPAGVVFDLSWQICDVSGIDFDKIAERQNSSQKIEGF